MLIRDMQKIGNKMFELRKKLGLTQADLAEKAGLSDRTYADIERGNVNMRIETLLRICDALHVTPDAILTVENSSFQITQDEIMKKYVACTEEDKLVALALMDVYLSAILK